MTLVQRIFRDFKGPANVGRAIGVATEHAAQMKRRGRIPPKHWPALIAAADARAIKGVTYEQLAQDIASRRPATNENSPHTEASAA